MSTNFTIYTQERFHKADSKTIGQLLASDVAELIKVCTDEIESQYKYSDVVLTQINDNKRCITASMFGRNKMKTVAVEINKADQIFVMTVIDQETQSTHRFDTMPSLIGNLRAEDAQIITALNMAF